MSDKPAGFAIEDAPQGSLPADIEAGIRATDWSALAPGKRVSIPVPAPVGAGNYTDDKQARSNRAYDVLQVVREVAGDTVERDGVQYAFGTKGTSWEDDVATVRVVLKRSK
jgi:hypothetical protein